MTKLDKMESVWKSGPDPLAAQPEGAGKGAGPRVGQQPHVGCPLAWFNAALRVSTSATDLAVALFAYRRSVVEGQKTVALTNVRLFEEMGLDRYAKRRALPKLAGAGLIRLGPSGYGSATVTILAAKKERKGRLKRD